MNDYMQLYLMVYKRKYDNSRQSCVHVYHSTFFLSYCNLYLIPKLERIVALHAMVPLERDKKKKIILGFEIFHLLTRVLMLPKLEVSRNITNDDIQKDNRLYQLNID